MVHAAADRAGQQERQAGRRVVALGVLADQHAGLLQGAVERRSVQSWPPYGVAVRRSGCRRRGRRAAPAAFLRTTGTAAGSPAGCRRSPRSTAAGPRGRTGVAKAGVAKAGVAKAGVERSSRRLGVEGRAFAVMGQHRRSRPRPAPLRPRPGPAGPSARRAARTARAARGIEGLAADHQSVGLHRRLTPRRSSEANGRRDVVAHPDRQPRPNGAATSATLRPLAERAGAAGWRWPEPCATASAAAMRAGERRRSGIERPHTRQDHWPNTLHERRPGRVLAEPAAQHRLGRLSPSPRSAPGRGTTR